MFARVSSRRLEKERKAEYEAEQTEQAILAIRKGIDQPGFLVKHIDENIGSGVFTSRSFEHGQFLIEYRGDLLTAQQGVEREAQYLETNSGCFIYFFRFKGKRYSVDATNYVESIGRMINDAAQGDPEQNCVIKVMCYEGKPHLCIFAVRHITVGEELRYDYGVPNLPWRKRKNVSKARGTKKTHEDRLETAASQIWNKKRKNEEKLENADHAVTPRCSVSSGIGNDQLHHITGIVDNVNPKDTSGVENVVVTGILDKSGCPQTLEIVDGNRTLVITGFSEDTRHKNTQENGDGGESINMTGLEAHRDIYGDVFGCGFSDPRVPKRLRIKDRTKEHSEEVYDFPDSNSDFSDYDDMDIDKDYKPETSDASDASENESDVNEALQTVSRESHNVHDLIISETHNHVSAECQGVNDSSIDQVDKNGSSIFVLTTGDKGGSRAYDKRYYCPYCRNPQAKLPRHLSSIHADEPEVIQYISATNKAEKDRLICKIRNLGNHLQNSKVIKEGKGNLMVVYRPSSESSWEDYLPCDMCLGYYSKNDLWKHRKRCPLLPEGSKVKGRAMNNAQMLMPVTKDTSEGLRKVLSSLCSDGISRILKSDQLILKLGEKLYLKLGNDQDQHSTIRNTMREIGRILQCLRKTIGPKDGKLADFIQPMHFQSVVNAAKNVAGFDEETHLFKTPSLALKIGHSIKKCAKIQKGIALQTGDEVMLTQSTRFLQLCEDNWTEEISTHALRTLGEKKRNNKAVRLIPLTSDCKLLSDYLKQKGTDAYDALESKNNCTEAWMDLCEVALVQIILFNRRRQGEVSKMRLEDLESTPSGNEDDVLQCLSDLERQLCKSLTRIEIVGKRGRTVPIILTSEMKRWVDLLVKYRKQVGIDERNKYVFARGSCGSLNHIRGSDCLRAFSEDCGATEPRLLRSTKLRKQIATLSQVLNLKDNEIDLLANFLGHDIRVHREFYRLPEHTLQVAKVSKLLFSLENGQFKEQCGRTMSEIDVHIDEELGIEFNEEEMSDCDLESEDKDENENENPIYSRSTEDATRIHSRSKIAGKKQPWSELEKAAVARHFMTHIELGRIPKKAECERCLRKEPSLRGRNWKNIKDFVRNKITTKKNKSKMF